MATAVGKIMFQKPARTRVKICGITNVKDALTAVNAGADALGFVFYEKSPRHVEVKDLKAVFAALPAFVTTVALFVNPSESLVNEVISELKVDLLQFHGDESPSFCEQFTRPYIKAVRMQEQTDLAELAEQYNKSKGLLLDAYVKGTPGGTGEAFNWQWVSPDVRKNIDLPIILAGGLNSTNVAEAIEVVQPWAVDVSGGVEGQSPSVKSMAKIQAFIAASS